MAVPYVSYVQTILAGIGVGNSASVTCTLNLTNGWENRFGIDVYFPANVSAGPQVSVYRSTDGGLTYATVPQLPVGIARQSGGHQKIPMVVQNGMYAIQIMVGGGSNSTWSVALNTQELLSFIG